MRRTVERPWRRAGGRVNQSGFRGLWGKVLQKDRNTALQKSCARRTRRGFLPPPRAAFFGCVSVPDLCADQSELPSLPPSRSDLLFPWHLPALRLRCAPTASGLLASCRDGPSVGCVRPCLRRRRRQWCGAHPEAPTFEDHGPRHTWSRTHSHYQLMFVLGLLSQGPLFRTGGNQMMLVFVTVCAGCGVRLEAPRSRRRQCARTGTRPLYAGEEGGPPLGGSAARRARPAAGGRGELAVRGPPW